MSLPPLDSHSDLLSRIHSLQNQRPQQVPTATNRVELQVTNAPQSLIYKSAIEQINEALQADQGEHAIEAAASSGLDFSPQAVAERILSFVATGLAGYRQRHADEGGDQQLEGFMALVRGAIDRGFEEARSILDGLGVLQGDIAADADRSYALIQDGLARFEDEQREASSEGS